LIVTAKMNDIDPQAWLRTHVCTIEYVATLIGENLELLREIASNSDNIDYGEMIHVDDGSDEGITTFTDRGIESLQEFLADVRC
jgi:hypothetical protein